MPARHCLLIGLALFLVNGAFADGVRSLDAGRVRLLPGSAFYERQELYRTNYLASWNCDKLLFHYRTLAKLPQPEGVKGGADRCRC